MEEELSQEPVDPDQMMEGFDDEPLEQEGPKGFEDFPPEVQEDVQGLMWLGYLEDEFSFCGHHFVLRTLRGDEELLASLVSKEWVDSLGQTRAWAWSQVALALVSVDYDENFCPQSGPDRRAYARARFTYVTQNWYWPVCEFLFDKYIALQNRQKEALKESEKFIQREPAYVLGLCRLLDKQGRLGGTGTAAGGHQGVFGYPGLNRLQSRLLTFYLKEEMRQHYEEIDETFRQRVFASDPRLYKEVFEKRDDPLAEIEEWQPQSEDDVVRMMAELRQEAGLE